MSRRSTARLAFLAGVLSLTACDIPTAVPHWDTTWAVPVSNLELAVSSLLPNGITVTPDGRAFELSIGGSRTEDRLGGICDACEDLHGQMAPKPAFTSVVESGASLPDGFVSGSVIGGQALIELYHDFGFDPIRPSDMVRGSITILIMSAGDTLATDIIDGVIEDFPSGTRKLRTLPFRHTGLRDAIEISVIFDSPAGDLAHINSSSHFEMIMAPSIIQLPEARVRVQNQLVELDENSIDVVGGDSFINRIQHGAIVLDIDNPFQITGALSLTLSAPGVSIVRQIAIAPGGSERRVEFTGPELRSVLKGEEATMRAVGSVSAVGESVTIRPDQILNAKSRFELNLTTTEK
jgi:hypothetical protein